MDLKFLGKRDPNMKISMEKMKKSMMKLIYKFLSKKIED